MTELNREIVKIKSFTNSSREISPYFEEFQDKMAGRPCTDMYDFKYISKEERKKLNLSDAFTWKAIPKENVTEGQKVKKHRNVSLKDEKCLEDISNDLQEKSLEFLVNCSDDVQEQLKEKIREDIDKLILEKLLNGDIY